MRLTATLAMLLAACSAPVDLVLDGSVEARPVECAAPGTEPAPCQRLPGTTVANCGPDDDPDYFWIHVCGDAWLFECHPEVTPPSTIWPRPCPGCIDGAPTCGEHGRPNCVPIPRDCAEVFYRGPERG